MLLSEQLVKVLDEADRHYHRRSQDSDKEDTTQDVHNDCDEWVHVSENCTAEQREAFKRSASLPDNLEMLDSPRC